MRTIAAIERLDMMGRGEASHLCVGVPRHQKTGKRFRYTSLTWVWSTPPLLCASDTCGTETQGLSRSTPAGMASPGHVGTPKEQTCVVHKPRCRGKFTYIGTCLYIKHIRVNYGLLPNNGNVCLQRGSRVDTPLASCTVLPFVICTHYM